MPSPFPGMDPWLEDPEIFPDLHRAFVVYLQGSIQGQLPGRYIAALGQRRWVEDPHDEEREPFIDIYLGPRRERRLVTTAEVRTPTNKTPNTPGNDLYLRRWREIRDSKVNFVEIDLLRPTNARPEHPAGSAIDYHVRVHRLANVEEYWVYPIQLDRLPRVEVPLLENDPAVSIDLQAVFDRCYNAASYSREVRYLQDEPVPPLTPDQMAWARERIQHAGSS